MTEKKNETWSILSIINCNHKVKQKGKLNYLSWIWAWGIVKEKFPEASYKTIYFGEKPYLYDKDLGYLVSTEVTINGETLPMHLPVTDGANKSQKNVTYTYETKFGAKECEAASMFDINTAIMRCLTKNLALFGLGHYIYAGEDLPQSPPAEPESKPVLSPDEPERWAKAIEALSTGAVTTDFISDKYKVTVQHLKELQDASI